MCDTPNNNASSSTTEERQRIITRIDTRIASLITPIDENEHINLEYCSTLQDSFTNKLKRKLEDSTVDTSVKLPNNKTMKPTINQYYPVNIATINVRGLNDHIKQHQILDYILIEH